MKGFTVLLSALLVAGNAMAGEKNETAAPYCKALSSAHVQQGSLAPTISPKFYVTSVADYRACRKMAAKKGAHVIIDPNA